MHISGKYGKVFGNSFAESSGLVHPKVLAKLPLLGEAGLTRKEKMKQFSKIKHCILES